MFDNLRDLSDSPLYEEDQNQDDDLFKDIEEDKSPAPASVPVHKKRRSGNFLGMTAQQRFLISVMLMIAVCMLGTLAMFALGRMSIF
jgi:hypothetical protein